MDGWWGERLRVKESPWLVHRLLPCSDECFISITILLVGYLLSPSWRLMVQPVSHTALGPEDNPLHCVSAASLPQLNNNTINCNRFQFSENDTFHLWDEMWTVILCCCYIKLFTIPNIRNDFSGNLLKLISPWLPCLPLYATRRSPDPWL